MESENYSFEGSKILTDNGYKNIENITSQDKLLSHKGEFKNILNLEKKIFNDEIYQLKIHSYCYPIEFTLNQKIYVKTKIDDYFSKPYWKKINNLEADDYIGLYISNDNNKTNINWYLLGYFFHNGYIIDKSIFIRIPYTHIDVFLEFSKILNLLVYKIHHKSIDKSITFKAITNEKLFNIFKLFNNTIPQFIYNEHVESISLFLDGFIKSNNIKNNKNVFLLPVKSYSFALDFQRLFLKCKYIISIGKKLIDKKEIYYITNSNISLFSSLFGDTLQFIDQNYLWSRITYIVKKKVTNKIIYKIEVEDDNSYIIENIII